MAICGGYSVLLFDFPIVCGPRIDMNGEHIVIPIPARYRGSVLLLAMIFMLMLAMAAATMMQSATLQLQMAGNDQFYEEAIQHARAIANELAHNRENFSMSDGVGSVRCPVGVSDSRCDSSDLQPLTAVTVPEGLDLDYRIVRQDPLLVKGFPFRESESKASSIRNVGVALFEIDVVVDGSELRLGRAQLVQGIAVRLAGLQ